MRFVLRRAIIRYVLRARNAALAGAVLQIPTVRASASARSNAACCRRLRARGLSEAVSPG